MSFLVVLIIDDPDNCQAVLDAWEDAGTTGITILWSSGLGRLRKAAFLEDMPLMPSLREVLSRQEIHHRTLLSVVKDEATADRLVEATQRIIGDLDQPNTGFLFVVPVLRAYGLNRKKN